MTRRLILAFAIAILAGFLTLGALEAGWQAAYNHELAARGGQDPMDDWGPMSLVWDRPASAGPGYSLIHIEADGTLIRVVTHGPPYPEPLKVLYGR